MTIRLEKLIPLPMLEQDTSGSGIWEKEGILFEQGVHYQVEASSGRGKTSLLAMVYGLRRDYQGQIFIDGEDTATYSRTQWSVLRKEKISFIFQGLELFDELSGLDNILLKNRITDCKSEKEIRDMAALLGMEQHLDKAAGILSFGQQQRVAIIRALCQPYEFLLADECFSHIDRDNSLIAFELMEKECAGRSAGLVLTALNQLPEIQKGRRILL